MTRPPSFVGSLGLVLGLALAALTLVTTPRPAAADEQRVWVKDVPDEATWNKYSRTLNGDQFGKFVIQCLRINLQRSPIDRDGGLLY